MVAAFSSCASVFLSYLHFAAAFRELVDMSILSFTSFLEYQDGEATETKET